MACRFGLVVASKLLRCWQAAPRALVISYWVRPARCIFGQRLLTLP